MFICYRRDDSWDHTDTIATVLPRAFWKRFKVFQDVTSISGGIEWKAYDATLL